jgi:Tol biopolymer transport system component
MLSGRRAFRGETAIDTMTAILKEDPPELSTTGRDISPALQRLVTRCLEKNPATRFQSARDLAFDLEGLSSHSGAPEPAKTRAPQRKARERLAWMTAGAAVTAIAALAIGGGSSFERAGVEPQVFRAALVPSSDVSVTTSLTPNARFALSPDGRRIAFVGADSRGVSRLWVQSLDGLDARPLAGTEGAVLPFWSPDSRFVGFLVAGRMHRIDTTGGPAIALPVSTGSMGGATWGREGVILFASAPRGPINRASATGGAVSAATTLDAAIGETWHLLPSFLPDGRHFLYLAAGGATAGPSSPNGIYVGSLDSSERKLLVPGGSGAMYADGHLFFLRGQTLMAQPFDVARLELAGEPVPVADGVTMGGFAGANGGFSVSDTGVLAYQTGPVEAGGQGGILTRLTWFDRSGRQVGVLADEMRAADLELAPDGRRATVSLFDLTRRTRDIWLFDVTAGRRTRFTFDPGDELASVWSPEGGRIVFNSRRKGHLDLYVRGSSGTGAEEDLLVDDRDKTPFDWSPDGRFVLFNVLAGETSYDLWALSLTGDRKAFPVVQTASNEFGGQFSPDGRWVAYTTNESGQFDVYVVPFPGPGGKWQVSAGGGGFPRWRRDGGEIFHLNPDNALMAVGVDGRSAAFEVGTSRLLFKTRVPTGLRSSYDVSPDGQRFLVNTLIEEAIGPITLLVNWPALVNK